MSLALMHKIAANSDIQKRTYEYSLWFCNHSVNLHEIFLHRTNSKSLYLGGIYIFFSYLSRLSVGFLLFSAPMCISLTFCNPECRRKNSSAKSKQGKIEDMHSWRCFPLGAIHKWRHQFFLIFDPSLPYISTYVLLWVINFSLMISFIIYGRPLRMQATFFVLVQASFVTKIHNMMTWSRKLQRKYLIRADEKTCS